MNRSSRIPWRDDLCGFVRSRSGLSVTKRLRCAGGSRQERHSARRRGGIARTSHKLTLPPDAPRLPLASIADVLTLLEATANEVRRGQLETRLANCVGYLCSVALNGLAQIPGPHSPVSVSFVVQAPMPCPICKTETGKACAQCQGMGYVSASKQPSETVS